MQALKPYPFFWNNSVVIGHSSSVFNILKWYKSAMRGLPQQGGRHCHKSKPMMPCSPRKYVQTVSDLTTKASPRKNPLFNSLKEQCVEQKTGREVLGRLKSISKRHSKDVNYTRSVLLSVFCKYKHSPRTSSSLLGVHSSQVCWTCSKPSK